MENELVNVLTGSLKIANDQIKVLTTANNKLTSDMKELNTKNKSMKAELKAAHQLHEKVHELEELSKIIETHVPKFVTNYYHQAVQEFGAERVEMKIVTRITISCGQKNDDKYAVTINLKKNGDTFVAPSLNGELFHIHDSDAFPRCPCVPSYKNYKDAAVVVNQLNAMLPDYLSDEKINEIKKGDDPQIEAFTRILSQMMRGTGTNT
jgi:hypothetical protein